MVKEAIFEAYCVPECAAPVRSLDVCLMRRYGRRRNGPDVAARGDDAADSWL